MKGVITNCTRAFLVVLSLLLFGACSHHAYVGIPQGQPSRDVEIPSGATSLIPIGASFVGMAYEEDSDHLFIRVVPGTHIQELDRTGRRIRSFSAQQVTAGCDGINPSDDTPVKECALAMRYSDRHLFLDHPGGQLIAEIDIDGNFVQNIRVAQPDGPIGGLAYDQEKDTLYVLFIRSRAVVEMDLSGNTLRRLQMTNPQTGAVLMVERFGLSMNSHRRELYLALHNGNRLGVFDLNGNLKAEHNLSAAVTVHGIGAGRRTF